MLLARQKKFDGGTLTPIGLTEQSTENRHTNQRSVRPCLFGQLLDAKRSTSMVVEFFKDLKIYGNTHGSKASRL